MNGTNTNGREYAEPLNCVTGFDIENVLAGTVRLYIQSGYVGLQKCNYSEVMMHMGRSDKTMKFKFYTTEHTDYTSESVQLLNADGSNWSGSVTRGEGGVYGNYREGADRMYYYYLPVTEMTDEYASAMSACDESYRRDCEFGHSTTREGDQWAAEQKEIDRLAEKFCLHPTVLHDICEAVIQAQNTASVPGVTTDDAWGDDSSETQELECPQTGVEYRRDDSFGEDPTYEPAHSTDQPMKDMAD